MFKEEYKAELKSLMSTVIKAVGDYIRFAVSPVKMRGMKSAWQLKSDIEDAVQSLVGLMTLIMTVDQVLTTGEVPSKDNSLTDAVSKLQAISETMSTK